MEVVVTNISGSPLYVRDLYVEIPAGKSVTIERSSADLTGMDAVIEFLAAGKLAVTVTPSASEIASGFLTPPMSVEPQDMAPVAEAAVLSPMVLLRVAFVADVGGAPDDVVGLAVNTLPFKFRVVDAWGRVTTSVGGSSLEVRTRVAGAGTLMATISSAAVSGRVASSVPFASAAAIPGATEGLFVRRSDNGVAAEVFLLVRRES